MMIDLNLKKKETRFQDVEREVLSVFYTSSTGKSNRQFRFAKIDSKFSVYLPYLKDGAVKLYLYYALVANNESGVSWYSLDTISRKLSATDRSIGNWNHELEDMGLIYRTNSGKKSKATYVLPLTGFAVKMGTEKIMQMLQELKLCDSNAYSRVFGRVQSLTKLYVKPEGQDAIHRVQCLHLQKVNQLGDHNHLESIHTFLYDVTPTLEDELVSKLLAEKYEEKVVIVQGDADPGFEGMLNFGENGFLINAPIKLDDTAVYDIMMQLVEDNDLSELPVIEL